jgi:hypothetical protein
MEKFRPILWLAVAEQYPSLFNSRQSPINRNIVAENRIDSEFNIRDGDECGGLWQKSDI